MNQDNLLFEQMTYGMDLTPEQTKEVRRLFRRSALPVRPWMWNFAGGLGADTVGVMGLMAVLNNPKVNKEYTIGFCAFFVIQLAAIWALHYRGKRTQKQLYGRIHEIKAQNSHQR